MKKHGFKQRLFQPLKGDRIPSVMLFTDTETHADKNSIEDIQLFTLGWVFLWKSSDEAVKTAAEYHFFDDPAGYCKYFDDMAKRHQSIMIYGHNIFFDLQCAGFFKYFTDQKWQLEWVYDKGMTYILRIVKGNKKIMAVSSTNYFDCSLKELGQLIRLEKKEILFGHCSRAQLKAYCYRDTEIVMHGMWYYIDFIRAHNLGKMALTKSSQALTAYRTRFMHTKIYMHSEETVFDLERKAYFGGRTEAFRIGKIAGDDFLTLDINSMYPYVMSEYKYPSKLLCIVEDEPIEKYTDFLGGYGLIAEVDLDTPEPAFACRYKKKLIFPTGQFRTFLTTEGLRYAAGQGYIKKIYRGAFYRMEDLFSDYVDYFRVLREEYQEDHNKVMVKLTKYMHNTLYGKWAEKEILTDIRDNDTGIDYLHREIWDGIHGGWWLETYLMNKIVMQHHGGEGYHSFPAIAAHITENARLMLWNIIKLIGPDKVLYSDTDSVIIHNKDLESIRDLLSETELGGLKVQDRFKSLQIDGAKNYRTGEVRHIKGIPADADEISPGVFRYDSFQRQNACLRDGQITGVKITPVIRKLSHTYNKGQILPDGRVKPYHFTFLEPLV